MDFHIANDNMWHRKKIQHKNFQVFRTAKAQYYPKVPTGYKSSRRCMGEALKWWELLQLQRDSVTKES